MPIYGYRCEECGNELEVFQSMSDAPLKICSKCGGPLRKLLYPVGVQFKGSGFYSTDYKNGRDAGKTESKTETESKSGDGSSSKEKAGEKAGEKTSEKSGEKKAEPTATKEKD
jgi:putative FmdB family regulatory protein